MKLNAVALINEFFKQFPFDLHSVPVPEHKIRIFILTNGLSEFTRANPEILYSFFNAQCISLPKRDLAYFVHSRLYKIKKFETGQHRVNVLVAWACLCFLWPLLNRYESLPFQKLLDGGFGHILYHLRHLLLWLDRLTGNLRAYPQISDERG